MKKFLIPIILLAAVTTAVFSQETLETINRALNQDYKICVNVGGTDNCLTLQGTTGHLQLEEHLIVSDGTDQDATIEFDGATDSKWRIDGLSSIGTPASGFRIRDVDRGVDVLNFNVNGGATFDQSVTAPNILIPEDTGGIGRNNESVSKWARAAGGTSCVTLCEVTVGGGGGKCIAHFAKTVGSTAATAVSSTTGNRACICLCDDF